MQGNIKGYRTLCMAVTELTDKEYMEWEPGYYRASIALDSREMLIEQQAEKIERVWTAFFAFDHDCNEDGWVETM